MDKQNNKESLEELLGEDDQVQVNKILKSDWLKNVKEESRAEGIDNALNHARQVISQYLATAEKWRYDRVLWAFAIMLGEIPEDSPEPRSPADDEMDRMRRYRIEHEKNNE